MALTTREESKSLRVTCRNDEGADVFSAGATYSTRSVNLNFEMLDAAYCAEHGDEVQSAISSFIGRLNGLLSEDNLPIINA